MKTAAGLLGIFLSSTAPNIRWAEQFDGVTKKCKTEVQV
jgi:hypothetical protein